MVDRFAEPSPPDAYSTAEDPGGGWTAEEWYHGRLLAATALLHPLDVDWAPRAPGVASSFAICAAEILERQNAPKRP